MIIVQNILKERMSEVKASFVASAIVFIVIIVLGFCMGWIRLK